MATVVERQSRQERLVMSMKPQDSISVTSLSRDTDAAMTRVRLGKRPLFITVKGKAKVVLLDPEKYSRMMSGVAAGRLLAAGEDDIRAGRYSEAGCFFTELRRTRALSAGR